MAFNSNSLGAKPYNRPVIQNSNSSPSAIGQPFKVSLIFPLYNEEALLQNNLARAYQSIERMFAEDIFELILVNDGSTDLTAEIAQTFAGSRSNIKLLHHKTNSGLGAALRTGFKEATGEVVIPIDSDLSYSLDHLPSLISTIHSAGVDVALLSPYMANGKVTSVPWNRRLLSRAANLLLYWAKGRHIHTSTCMVRAYKRSLLDQIQLNSTGPEINLELLLKALQLNAKVSELPAHLDWSSCNNTNQRCSRIPISKLFRQVSLVLRYSLYFTLQRRSYAKTY